MAIKVVRLRSGEDVVTDLSDIRDKETGVRQAFVFNKPFKITIEREIVAGTEERNQQYTGRIYLEQWQPLTNDQDIAIMPDWVISISNPIMSVLESYGQTLKPEEEAKATFGTDVSTVANVEVVDDK